MLECDSKQVLVACCQNPTSRRAWACVTGGAEALPWLSGLLTAPLWWLLLRFLPPSTLSTWAVALAASVLAPLPGLVAYHRRHNRLAARAAQAHETAAQLKFQLETVRFRTARLREDLSAADQQARLSHQLSILGQFTAGFMHEFNNPLSIVTSRLEVLLEERRDDAALCADLRQMLQEARYMVISRAHCSRLCGASAEPRASSPRFLPVPWRRLRRAEGHRRAAGGPPGAGDRGSPTRERARARSERSGAWFNRELAPGPSWARRRRRVAAARSLPRRRLQSGPLRRGQWSRRAGEYPRAFVRAFHHPEPRAGAARPGPVPGRQPAGHV